MSINKSPLDLPQALVEIGKSRGFLTYADIADHLPDVELSDELLESIVLRLSDQGIAIHEESLEAGTVGLLNFVEEVAPIAMSDLGAARGADASVKCQFSFVCDRQFWDLKETEDPDVRFCDGCSKSVHLCWEPQDAIEAIKAKRCVALMFSHSK